MIQVSFRPRDKGSLRRGCTSLQAAQGNGEEVWMGNGPIYKRVKAKKKERQSQSPRHRHCFNKQTARRKIIMDKDKES